MKPHELPDTARLQMAGEAIDAARSTVWNLIAHPYDNKPEHTTDNVLHAINAQITNLLNECTRMIDEQENPTP